MENSVARNVLSSKSSPILGIQTDFRVVDEGFSSELIQSYLQVEELGLVHLRGHASGEGRLIVRGSNGPVRTAATKWNLKWEGIFCAWVVDIDDPILHGFRPDIVEDRPNTIHEISGHRVCIQDEQLLRPMLIPLTKYYLGRHARMLSPSWPKVNTETFGWGTLLLPPW